MKLTRNMTSPSVGLLGGMVYLVANIGGTLAPIVIGLVVNKTGNYTWGLIYISCIAAMGVIAYVFIMGNVYRTEIRR
jgi:ACS family D-galactonate transporter-like MFS transporter